MPVSCWISASSTSWRSNDLGLLAEEFSPEHQRLAGNFPQAFSHLGHLRAAQAVERAEGSVREAAQANSPS